MKYFSQKLSLLKQKGKQIKNTLLNLTSKPELIPISQHVYYIFTTSSLKQSYEFILAQFDQFRILNFDQSAQQFFTESITRINMNGQPVLPLIRLLEFCTEIKKCVSSKSFVVLRGAECSILLAMYLYLSGKFQHLLQALMAVNQRLHINKDETQFHTQHYYFKNCINLVAGLKTNNKSLILKRVVFSSIPVLKKPNEEGVIQKFQPNVFICSGANKFNSRQFKEQEGKIVIEINHEIMDDVMVLVKHQSNPHVHFVCFRFVLNTNFVEGKRAVVGLIDMDPSQIVQFKEGFIATLEFEEGGSYSKLDTVWQETNKFFNRKMNKSEQKETNDKLKGNQKINSEKNNQKLSDKQNHELIEKQQQSHTQSIDEIDSQEPQPEIIASAIQKMIEKGDTESAEDIDDYISKLEESINH